MPARLAGCANLAAFLSLLASVRAFNYDPTKDVNRWQIQNGSWAVREQGCPTNGTNHPADPWAPVLPAVGPQATFDVAKWSKAYDEAMASPNPLPALQALKASKAGFNLRVGNRVENWFGFINGKAHVLSVLDGSGVFSRPGGSLLDVGCGHGFLDAFVMGRYGIKVVGIELGRSYQCSKIMASPLTIHFYDGRRLALAGQPIPARSFEAVSFISVLHHAASATPALLQQAAAIAQKWILVNEDLGKPLPKSSFSQQALDERNYKHDPTGIFRSDEAWRHLFLVACPSFRIIREGLLPQRVATKSKAANGEQQRIVTSVRGVEHRRFQKWYLLERYEG